MQLRKKVTHQKEKDDTKWGGENEGQLSCLAWHFPAYRLVRIAVTAAPLTLATFTAMNSNHHIRPSDWFSATCITYHISCRPISVPFNYTPVMAKAVSWLMSPRRFVSSSQPKLGTRETVTLPPIPSLSTFRQGQLQLWRLLWREVPTWWLLDRVGVCLSADAHIFELLSMQH